MYRLPYTPRVPRVYLRCLGSKIEAVMGLSTWHLCFKMCLEEPFHATKPRSTYFSGAKNHRLHVVATSQENRYTHLTYAPATHLQRGDVSKMTKYDFSSFTKGFPKIDKIGHQLRTSVGEPYPEKTSSKSTEQKCWSARRTL